MGNLKRDVFIYGKIGSGKDLISNYLQNKGYGIFRLSGTIKQIIMEKKDLSFEEIENGKRMDFELRKLHHTIGDYLGNDETTTNRLKALVNRYAMDMYNFRKDKPIVVNDIRTQNNIMSLFLYLNLEQYDLFRKQHNFDKPAVIFLSRLSEEHLEKVKNGGYHYTDENCIKFDYFKYYISQKLITDKFDVYMIFNDNYNVINKKEVNQFKEISDRYNNFHVLENKNLLTDDLQNIMKIIL